MQTLLTVLLAGLTLLAVSLQRTYSRLSLKELKHRARKGDNLAEAMLKAVGYGHSLRAFLWILIGISSAGFFVVVTKTAPIWFALTSSVVLVWLGFVLIPAARVSYISQRIAAWCAPVLGKILGYLHPLTNFFERRIRRLHQPHKHTGLYDHHDLIDLLNQQQSQDDNRIEKTKLEIALNALTFGDETIAQHMVSRRGVKAVSVDDPLGPIIMDELHSSGYTRFPVYEGKKDNIIGILYLRDLIHSRKSGTVRNLMKPEVSYVHEDQSLQDALQAILVTHHQLFVVVNGSEEYVGIITIEDVMQAIIGNPILDEFDDYHDAGAVASRPTAAKRHESKDEESPTPIPEEHIDETIEL